MRNRLRKKKGGRGVGGGGNSLIYVVVLKDLKGEEKRIMCVW